MATQSPATIARRAARKATLQHFAAAGIRLEESQARFLSRTGITTQEYIALRTAFGLGEAHKPVIRAASASRAMPRTAVVRKAAPKVFTSSDYRSHVRQPGKGGDSAWVSTDGTFYSVEYAGHNAFARKCNAAGIVTSSEYGSYVGALERRAGSTSAATTWSTRQSATR